MTLAKLQQDDFWHRHILEYKSSGLSRAAYCRKHDIKLHQFKYRLVHLNNGHDTDKKPFARVVVSKEQSNQIGSPTPVRVRFPGGSILEVAPNSDPVWLGRLIDHVGGRS